MTTSFFDTSALAKLFLAEIGSQAIRSYVPGIDDDVKTMSILTQVEIRSVLQRRFRNRSVTANQLQMATDQLKLIAARWLIVDLDNLIVEYAAGVIARYALRSLDAIQLASAMSLRDELQPRGNLLFVATDERLLSAAVAEGFTIWNPETASAPLLL